MVNWGDGSVTGATISSTAPDEFSISASHTYADNGTYTATLLVLDGFNALSDSMVVVVVNESPTLTVASNQVVDENTAFFLSDIGSFVDPGFHNSAPFPNGPTFESFTYHIQWGDGTAADQGSATIDVPGGPGQPTSGSFDAGHTYITDGIYTVTVRLADDDMTGNFSTGTAGVDFVESTFQIVANNLGPNIDVFTLTSTGGDPPNTDEAVRLHTEFSDTIPRVFQVVVDWGDGTGMSFAVFGQALNFDFDHFYENSGTYTVTLEIQDGIGGSKVEMLDIFVNARPVADGGGPYNVFEGESIILSGAASIDANDQIADYEWDLSYDGVLFDVDATGITTLFDATNIDGPVVRTVALRVRDTFGAESVIDSFEVTVQNLAPEILTLSISADASSKVMPTELVTVEGSFTDFVLDTHTVSVDWGDGTVEILSSVDGGAIDHLQRLTCLFNRRSPSGYHYRDR